jgi:hypothetical protein
VNAFLTGEKAAVRAAPGTPPDPGDQQPALDRGAIHHVRGVRVAGHQTIHRHLRIPAGPLREGLGQQPVSVGTARGEVGASPRRGGVLVDRWGPHVHGRQSRPGQRCFLEGTVDGRSAAPARRRGQHDRPSLAGAAAMHRQRAFAVVRQVGRRRTPARTVHRLVAVPDHQQPRRAGESGEHGGRAAVHQLRADLEAGRHVLRAARGDLQQVPSLRLRGYRSARARWARVAPRPQVDDQQRRTVPHRRTAAAAPRSTVDRCDREPSIPTTTGSSLRTDTSVCMSGP